MTSHYPAPYDPSEDEEPAAPQASARSRGVALVLASFGGLFGLHRFYTGKTESGIWMAVTMGGLTFWWLYDLVLLIAGEFRDSEGLPLREWGVADAVGRAAPDSRQLAQLTEQLDQMQQQLGELAERMDFTERLLTQQRERDRLPRGS
ncbi:MAG: NINE protein [Acidobacteriota bacterium]